jgi:Tol biopolymer transport system component
VAAVKRDGTGFRDLTASRQAPDASFYPGWWAPDSQSVFVYDFHDIRRVSLDGRETSRVACSRFLGDVELSSGLGFALSPDGKRLLFDAGKDVPDVRVPDGPASLIFLSPMDDDAMTTTAPRRVSPKGMCATSPVWLRGGASFLARSTGGKTTDIHLVDLATGKSRLILKNADNPSASR